MEGRDEKSDGIVAYKEQMSDLMEYAIGLSQYIEILIIFLFLQRLKLVELHIQANNIDLQSNLNKIVKQINFHVKTYRLSYCVASVYMLSWILSLVKYISAGQNESGQSTNN